MKPEELNEWVRHTLAQIQAEQWKNFQNPEQGGMVDLRHLNLETISKEELEKLALILNVEALRWRAECEKQRAENQKLINQEHAPEIDVKQMERWIFKVMMACGAIGACLFLVMLGIAIVNML